jgi:long-chain acyl-CoA synthetase
MSGADVNGNAATTADACDFVQLLEAQAARRPHAVWLNQPIDGHWHTFTWTQALDEVRRMAAALSATGYPPGSRIAISGRNTAHWFLADLAITMAGFVTVGLYPRQSAGITRYIFEHAQIRAVFVGPALDIADLLAAVPPGIPRWSLPYPDVPTLDGSWNDMTRAHAPFTHYTAPPSDRMVMLVYTSGTSGFPKGVMLSAGNIAFATQRFLQHVLLPHGFMQPRGSDRLFSYLPLAHFFERLVCEGGSLITGAQVFFLEKLEAMGETLRDVAPSMFCGVPLVYSRLQAGVLAKLPQPRLDALLRVPLLSAFIKRSIRRTLGLHRARFILTGAAPISTSLLAWFARLGIDVHQGCAPTECFAYLACNLRGADRAGSIGRPLPGADVKLGADDEILVRHAGVMLGYLNDDDATRDAFTDDGYLRTGDKGRFDVDGYLYVIGRTKDIFKTMKGRYVAPAPIEEAIRTADIEHCCLVGPGVPQPILLADLSADARRKPRAHLQRELLAVLARVNAGLESHAQVAKLVIVAEPWTSSAGLLTPTLKVRREQVQRHYETLIAREAANREPFVWEAPD